MADLKEYLREQVPHVHIENCKAVIKAYRKFKQGQEKNYCGICLKIFTREEKHWSETHASPYWYFPAVCKDHLEHAQKVNVHRIRQELGISDEEIAKRYEALFLI